MESPQVTGDTFNDGVILVCLTPLRGGWLLCLTARLLRRPAEMDELDTELLKSPNISAGQTKQAGAVKVSRRALAAS